MNRVILRGNLTAHPTLRFTTSGTPVCNIQMATNENWTDRNTGEPRQRTEYHRIVIFGKQAENCKEYLSKGRGVLIEGRLQTRPWEDRDGNKRWTTEVRGDSVEFLAGGRREEPEDAPVDDAPEAVPEDLSDEEKELKEKQKQLELTDLPF